MTDSSDTPCPNCGEELEPCGIDGCPNDLCPVCGWHVTAENRHSVKRAAEDASEALLTIASADLALTGRERDAIALVRFLCDQISDDERR